MKLTSLCHTVLQDTRALQKVARAQWIGRIPQHHAKRR